jgi:photosystem II stability/assembly factor-like uncharacterized protein
LPLAQVGRNADLVSMRLRLPTSRLHASHIAGACAFALACVLASLPATAATSSSTIGATVVSATMVDPSGCRSGVTGSTSLGTLTASTGVVGSLDCTIGFGSSNDIARLELSQGDGTGTMLGSLSTTQTRLQDDVRMHGVEATSASDAWAVGSSGTVQHWNGTTWALQAIATTSTLKDVAIGSSPGTVWVVGAGGLIRGTTTGGSPFPTQHSGSGTLNGIDATDDTHAWAVGTGGQIWYTTDGSTWNAAVSGTTEDLDGVVAVTSSIIVAVGSNGVIVRSIDGGLNFAPVTSGTTSVLNAITARDASVLFAAGGGSTILRSGNAGLTWAPVATNPPSLGYNAIATDAGGIVVAFSDHGNVARSTDDGSSWTTVNSGYQNAVQAAVYLPGAPSTTFAVGMGSLLMSSTDLGLSWSVDAAFRASLNGVYATSRNRAWAVGSRGDIRATTDGSTMTTQASGTVEELRDIDGAGTQSLWTVGANGTVRATTDGGATWTGQTSPITADLRGVDAVTQQVAWAVGGTSQAMRTTNGGATWNLLALPGSRSAYAVSAPNDQVAWVAGTSGYVVRTLDGGQTWSTITVPAAFASSTMMVSGADSTGQRAVIAGSEGNVYRTTDGGTTWSPVTGADGAYGTINGLDAHDTNSMALAVSGGTVLYSGDGTTWVSAVGGSPTRSNADVSYPGVQAIWSANDSWALMRSSAATSSVPDFNDDPSNVAGNDWGTPGAAFFGACLRALGSASVIDWAVDPNADCTATDTDPWRAIVQTSGTSGAPVARTSTPGATGTAALRFGMRAGSMPAGAYGGSIRIEVIAPG